MTGFPFLGPAVFRKIIANIQPERGCLRKHFELMSPLFLPRHAPPPTCPESSKSCCQVGGVGDRHTTFLRLDTNSETAPELCTSERITAVEIFKSCGPACNHTSFSIAPASFQRHRIPRDHGFEVSDSGAPRSPGPIQTNPTRPGCVPPLWHSDFWQ